MLQNKKKLLQGVSLQGTYPVPHLGLARLPRQSHDCPCHRLSSVALVIVIVGLPLDSAIWWDSS
jgi:hypothetical protein